ncbi:MAG: hypothetical protein IKG98_11630 [Ruminococcus sp.]|nr:hypothetical protein [Ruminococcus sp.]
MAHESQERYSSLVLAKLRKELVLSDGLVFNNDYEGDPTAGSVKIPVRDTEVTVSDYDKANGISATNGSTSYTDLVINKDKAVNEVIDGFDADSVPDNLVADRLDSAGYSLAAQLDTDGGTVLLAGATPLNVAQITKNNIYETIVDIRKAMSDDKIPNDGKRYLLVTPAAMALILKSPEFISASSLGDDVKQSGVVGKIAGFLVKEWADNTPGLAMLAGHPRFATRVNEWKVPVKIQNLEGSGKYIGASAVQGRMVYAHKVLRSVAIRSVYSPSALTLTVAVGTSTAGDTKVTATVLTAGDSLAYKKNPSERCAYGTATATYNGTSMTSGTAKVISSCSVGDVIEVVEFDSDGKAVAVGYVTLTADDIKA